MDLMHDSERMLRCVSLSAGTVSRRIDEMSNNVEKTLGSDLQQSEFFIQLDESTFCISNILMAYVRCNSLECVIDEFFNQVPQSRFKR